MEVNTFKGCIFDLDGVIVDTAHFHYLAWKKLANQLGFDFNELQNEALKGVSRKESLEYLLHLGGLHFSEVEKLELAESKNSHYIDMISNLDESALLPGAKKLLLELKDAGYKIALGSASKNARPVLESTGILPLFDFIADGNSTSKSKPDPAVFLIAATGIQLLPCECIVLEDAQKGIEAAIKGGFLSLGVGDEIALGQADHVVPNLENVNVNTLQHLYNFPIHSTIS
ncbi:MAG TPA: beta-phosphoglucomutase [Saprospiraceae bacterium]|nr:beta-phosphoglucomutase [Saprospiraceae bacterium]